MRTSLKPKGDRDPNHSPTSSSGAQTFQSIRSMLKPVSKDKSKESSSHSFYDINLKKVDKDEKSNDNGGPQWGKLKHVVIEEKPKVEEVEEGVEEETPEAEEPKISAAEKSPPRSPLRSPTGLQAGPGLNEQTADASSVEIDRLTSELKAATDKATNLTGALQESEDKRVACCAHEAFLADRLKDAERRIIDLQGSRCDRAQCVESIEQLRQKLLDAERQLAEQQGQDGVTDGDEESASREEVALLHTIVQSKDTEVESLSKQLKELKAMSQLSLIKATEQITSLEHANSQHVSLRAKLNKEQQEGREQLEAKLAETRQRLQAETSTVHDALERKKTAEVRLLASENDLRRLQEQLSKTDDRFSQLMEKYQLQDSAQEGQRESYNKEQEKHESERQSLLSQVKELSEMLEQSHKDMVRLKASYKEEQQNLKKDFEEENNSNNLSFSETKAKVESLEEELDLKDRKLLSAADEIDRLSNLQRVQLDEIKELKKEISMRKSSKNGSNNDSNNENSNGSGGSFLGYSKVHNSTSNIHHHHLQTVEEQPVSEDVMVRMTQLIEQVHKQEVIINIANQDLEKSTASRQQWERNYHQIKEYMAEKMQGGDEGTGDSGFPGSKATEKYVHYLTSENERLTKSLDLMRQDVQDLSTMLKEADTKLQGYSVSPADKYHNRTTSAASLSSHLSSSRQHVSHSRQSSGSVGGSIMSSMVGSVAGGGGGHIEMQEPEVINVMAKNRDPDQEALEAGLLLSKQEAMFGTNMYDSLTAADEPKIQSYIDQLGLEKEGAIALIFEEKYGKISKDVRSDRPGRRQTMIPSMPQTMYANKSLLRVNSTVSVTSEVNGFNGINRSLSDRQRERQHALQRSRLDRSVSMRLDRPPPSGGHSNNKSFSSINIHGLSPPHQLSQSFSHPVQHVSPSYSHHNQHHSTGQRYPEYFDDAHQGPQTMLLHRKPSSERITRLQRSYSQMSNQSQMSGSGTTNHSHNISSFGNSRSSVASASISSQPQPTQHEISAIMRRGYSQEQAMTIFQNRNQLNPGRPMALR